MKELFGLLNLHKPAGVTSRDVVNQIQRCMKPVKVGHAGTLDPMATGVLVLCIGPATRLIPYIQQMPKRYRAEFLLGRTSDTEDIEGEVELCHDAPAPLQLQIQDVLPQFVGRIQQCPPAYSALKVGGRRSYQLAREGQRVDHQSRPVTVHSIELVGFAYPLLTLDIRCGSGTYIRSLGRDLAVALGTQAVMSKLARTEIGCFTVETAAANESWTSDSIREHLLPPKMALAGLTEIAVNPGEHACLANGAPIRRPQHGLQGEIAACDQLNNLIAILIPDGADRLRPKRMLRQTPSAD